MSFSWKDFCRTHSIPYVTEGPSWTPGNINISCPFCGVSDSGHHMGLSTVSGKPYWHCWRNDSHAGRQPHRLIMKLIGCSRDYAESLVKTEATDLSDFDEQAAQFLSGSRPIKSKRKLELLSDFKPLVERRGRSMRYFDYMVEKRGFQDRDIEYLNQFYDMRYCDRCEFRGWKGRIIFPIFRKGELMSWTGRSIYPVEELRYKTLSHRPNENGAPQALENVRDLLYNYDHAISRKWKVCVLVEGVMDVLKIDYYGERKGICAVCTFGVGIRSEQLNDLQDVRDRCKHLVSCVDEGAELNLLRLREATGEMGLTNISLPEGIKDPGELSKYDIRRLFKNLSGMGLR